LLSNNSSQTFSSAGLVIVYSLPADKVRGRFPAFGGAPADPRPGERIAANIAKLPECSGTLLFCYNL
jgi:hypothetical protein